MLLEESVFGCQSAGGGGFLVFDLRFFTSSYVMYPAAFE